MPGKTSEGGAALESGSYATNQYHHETGCNSWQCRSTRCNGIGVSAATRNPRPPCMEVPKQRTIERQGGDGAPKTSPYEPCEPSTHTHTRQQTHKRHNCRIKTVCVDMRCWMKRCGNTIKRRLGRTRMMRPKGHGRATEQVNSPVRNEPAHDPYNQHRHTQAPYRTCGRVVPFPPVFSRGKSHDVSFGPL